MKIYISDSYMSEEINENLTELRMKTGKEIQEIVCEALREMYDKYKFTRKVGD